MFNLFVNFWNNYKIYEHYSSVGHCGFLEHVSKTLIDRTDPSDPLKREYY